MLAGASGGRAICTFPERRMEFGRDAFREHPPIAALSWNRRAR
jgi:hypothetical protein